jgi:hypothetical protein
MTSLLMSRRERRRPHPEIHRVWLALAGLLFAACALLSPYDPTSYKNATDLKAESLSLLEKGTEEYSAHATEVAQLELKLRQAFEYEHGKGKTNSDTAEQWKTLLDKDGGLLGGTLKQWKSAGHLSAALIPEISRKIGEAFDEIITLEQAKVKK